MPTPAKTPIQLLFITAFSIFFLYMIFSRLPLPEEVYGFSSQKLLKIMLGIAFCISGIVIYVTSKDKPHGSGR